MAYTPGAKGVGIVSLLINMALVGLAIGMFSWGIVAATTTPVVGAYSVNTSFAPRAAGIGITLGVLMGLGFLIASIFSCCAADCTCSLSAGSKCRNITFIVFACLGMVTCLTLCGLTASSASVSSLNLAGCFRCPSCEEAGYPGADDDFNNQDTCTGPSNNPHCLCTPNNIFSESACACALTESAQLESLTDCPITDYTGTGNNVCYINVDSEYFQAATALAWCSGLSAILCLKLLITSIFGVRKPDVVEKQTFVPTAQPAQQQQQYLLNQPQGYQGVPPQGYQQQQQAAYAYPPQQYGQPAYQAQPGYQGAPPPQQQQYYAPPPQQQQPPVPQYDASVPPASAPDKTETQT